MSLAAKISACKSSEPARKTVLPETFTPELFPESKSGQMQQTLIPTTCLTSISALVDRLVSHFQSLEKGRESTIPEVFSYLKLHGLSDPNDHAIYYLKTCKAYSVSKMGKLSETGSGSLMNYTMMSRSVIITLRITYRRTGHVSSLSALLEPPEKVPEKYYLSNKQELALIAKAKKDKANRNGFGYQIIGKNSNTITVHYAKDAHDNLLAEDKKTLKTIIHGSQSSRLYDPSGIAQTLTSVPGGMCAKTGLYAIPVLTPNRAKKRQQGRRFKTDGEPSFTLTCQDQHGIFDGFRVRALMPIECERLQGMPENWTKTGASGKEISDFQRYKCCGNAVSLPVVQHILERMMQNQ